MLMMMLMETVMFVITNILKGDEYVDVDKDEENDYFDPKGHVLSF